MSGRIFIVACSLAGLLLHARPALAAQVQQVRVERAIVEEFRYAGPADRRWLVDALRDRTIHNIKEIKQIEIIPISDQDKVLSLFEHVLKDRADINTTRVLGLALNARFILTGDLTVRDDDLRIDYRIIVDKKRFRVGKTGTLRGTLAGLADLENRLAEEFLFYIDVQSKAVTPTGDFKRRRFLGKPTRGFQAYRYYARGLRIEKKDPGEALRLYRAALEREPEFEEAIYRAGRSHQARTEYHRALRLFRRRLQVLNSRRLRNTRFYAETLLRIGDVHRSMKNNALALKSYREGNAILASIGLVNTEDYSTTVTYIGEIFKEKREYETALENFRQSKAIKDRLGLNLTFNYTNLLNNLGTVHFILNNFEDALVHFEEELKLKRALGLQNTVAFADTLTNEGVVYMNRGKQGDLTRARKNYDAALELRKKIGDQSSIGYANNLFNMGYMFATYYRDPCGATSWLRRAVRVMYANNPNASLTWLQYLNQQVRTCREQIGYGTGGPEIARSQEGDRRAAPFGGPPRGGGIIVFGCLPNGCSRQESASSLPDLAQLARSTSSMTM